MLLSIVMMIKNEEKYLDKTLEALKDLMFDIESELIILDTGSTDNSVDICKKYTDKVYFAKWNDNFAEMRNISISYAKGDWILVLDADEELIDYESLKKFFDSKLHLKYNCASIELKNIFNEDESSYNIVSIYRLFRNTPEFMYKGLVHEQPIYQKPAFNNVARFKHYGYVFEDEELRQKKDKRNTKLLLKELKKNSDDPYINYQLGKSYMIIGKNEDAAYHMKKSYDIYYKSKQIPEYISIGLANVYLNNKDFNKCESFCINYIKNDSKNIDIYYYLAMSQMNTGKYIKSIHNFEKYLFYIENYNLSTQSKSIYCYTNTISYKEKCKAYIVQNYYKLEMYNKIVDMIEEIDYKVIKDIYYMIVVSLYKMNKIEKIIKIYSDIINDKYDVENFRFHIERALKDLREDEKEQLYKLFSSVNDNYGILNKLRIKEEVDFEECKRILKHENQLYYYEIVYYMHSRGAIIEDILLDFTYLKLQQIFDYIILSKRDIIIDLYNYLRRVSNTLDIKKIHIYSALSKSLLSYGNLKGEKYENLFLMYVMYRYECVQLVYNLKLNNGDISNYITNKDDLFVANINHIEKSKENNKLEYLRKLKQLVKENKEYKEAIEILVKNFEDDFHEPEGMKDLKKQYKTIIEKSINDGQLDQALKLIDEYKTISIEDIDIKNMQGIIHILKNEYEEAEFILKQALFMDNNDVNTFFNIAYLKEVKLEKDEAIAYYKKVVSISSDEELVIEATNKINDLQNKKIDESICLFNKCLTLTDGSDLINDKKQRIKEIPKEIDIQKHTFITLGINYEDIIFNKLDKENNNIVAVIENSNIQYENKCEDDKIITYEINSEEICEKLEDIIEKNDNCIIICSDINKLNILKCLKEKCKIVYYTNTNLYTDKRNYLQHNIEMYLEKETCSICDFIITNNISVYTNKSIIEKRNVYLFNENFGELFDINTILKENMLIDKEEISVKLKNCTKNINSEYDKSLYILGSEYNNIEICLQVCDYIYINYNTEEIYQIYLSLLKEKKDYKNAILLATTSKYCDDIYKAELIYLNRIDNKDLIDFIIDISIKNYKYADLTSDYNLDYKMAIYNFELNRFENAYNKYMNVLNQNGNLTNSPLVNRNISYLMYASENDEYQEFYNRYKELIGCLNESECVVNES